MKILLPCFRAGTYIAHVTSCLHQARDPHIAESRLEPPLSPFAGQLPPLTSDSRRIFLVQHGETDYNRKGLVQGGGLDIELNDRGFDQSSKLRELLTGLPLQVVASSHLERACQTAHCVSEAFPDAIHVINHKFGEMRFGDFEGIQIHDACDNDGDWTKKNEKTREHFMGLNNIILEHKHVAWPGRGESVADVEQRGEAGIAQLLRSFPKFDHFCIVAHGRFNKILMQAFLGMSGRDVFQQGYACVNVLDVDSEGKWKARMINYMEHLKCERA